ncbi:MAG: DUF6465 family protein [Roseburia sp.]|nr:DUF6465 family protein [Roseburia sp.]
MAAPKKSAAAAKVTDTAAKTVKKATPVKAEEVKTTPVKTEEVKAEEVKTEVVQAEPAKKASAKKTAAKKAPVKAAKITSEIHIQFSGKSYSEEDLIKMAKDVWKYDLKRKVSEFKSAEFYVKPEESMVYYVINKEVTGSFII